MPVFFTEVMKKPGFSIPARAVEDMEHLIENANGRMLDLFGAIVFGGLVFIAESDIKTEVIGRS